MYKVSTELANYRFNTIRQLGNHNLTWFKMIDRVGHCLTEYEAIVVMAYFASRPDNFFNIVRLGCINDDCPGCGVRPLMRANRPSNLMLTGQPLLPAIGGQIFSCMFIELLSANGANNHNYNLPFDLLGMYVD